MRKFELKTVPEAARDRSPAPLICLLAGVLGMLLCFRSLPGANFSVLPVLAATAALCAALHFGYLRGGRAFGFLFAAAAPACALAAYLSRDALREQAARISDAFSGAAAGPADVTGLALALGAALSLLLFALEYLLRSHALFYLLTTALLLAAPLFGVRLAVEAALLVGLFQLGFWGWQLSRRRGMAAGKSALALCLAVALCCAAAAPLVSIYSEELYGAVAAAEGFLYRRAAGEGSGDPVTGGAVSRGNDHQLGVPQLELTASRQPAEPLYLRGFGGGEYVGGDWVRSSDEAVFRKYLEKRGWSEWYDEFRSAYYRMYYEANALTNPEAEPIALNIRHSSGSYPTAYVPYYGERQSGYGGGSGYTFRYYEQSDMNVDRAAVPEAREEYYTWYYDAVQEGYLEQIREDYTAVPAELLPRLTAFVEEHPLEGLDEITAFIIYTLHSNCEYTLTPGWMTLHQDAAEDFLFARQRGYCQHFALAATLMYRLYGVPARYATGYRVGPERFEPVLSLEEWWSSTLVTRYRATLTDADAHAWVEIFLPDYGWTPVEVTPTASGGAAVSYPGFDLLKLDRIERENGWDPSEPSLGEAAETSSAGSAAAPDYLLSEVELSGAVDRETRVLLWSVLILMLADLPVLLYVRRREKLAEAARAGCRAAFARLLEMLRFAGLLDGCDGSEPDFCRKLSAALPEISAGDAERLVAAVERAAFGPSAPGAEEDEFARRLYARAADSARAALPWRKRLAFRWVKAYG